MTRTLLTGATGTLGTALRPRLRAAGHTVRAASRTPVDDANEWTALDLATGEGVEAAVADADVVVHTASAPRGDSEAVDVEGTKRLLAAAEDAGVSNLLYVSIVGVDEIPLSYYEHKLAAERAVEASAVPSTVVRATQFHEFVADLLDGVSRLPVWPLPTRFRVQPVAVEAVAAAVVEHATPESGGRVSPVCGPEVLSLGEVARTYRTTRGLRRPVVRLPVPGAVARGFRDGAATCPDRGVGATWEEWLADRYGSTTTGPSVRTGSPS
ncbi:SDR family oxidoreductase [Halomarina rubra]|uniref:SDR family oxidoreductase n=1 Tax=Halomarina rubra TaxID=2071873 RepID=A0ABD6ATK1_9EURY|nr:NAD(P)H-binding protein [Halomarina rubra]